jgi:hypothetical protein
MHKLMRRTPGIGVSSAYHDEKAEKVEKGARKIFDGGV